VHINDYTSGQLAKVSLMSEEFMSIWAQKTSKWHKSVDEFFFVAPRIETPQSFCAFSKEMFFTHPGTCKKSIRNERGIHAIWPHKTSIIADSLWMKIF
jgi:hypothetical protein